MFNEKCLKIKKKLSIQFSEMVWFEQLFQKVLSTQSFLLRLCQKEKRAVVEVGMCPF